MRGFKTKDIAHLVRLAGERGAKPRRSRLREAIAEADPPPPLEPFGTLICSGVLVGRAVPWKSPEVDRYGRVRMTKDYCRYVDWYKTVQVHARQLMGDRKPYAGLVEMEVAFCLRPTGYRLPDRANLLKSWEDSLQGIVYRNDLQVAGGPAQRIVSGATPDRVIWSVYATGEPCP
jgi:hypothetical protein